MPRCHSQSCRCRMSPGIPSMSMCLAVWVMTSSLSSGIPDSQVHPCACYGFSAPLARSAMRLHCVFAVCSVLLYVHTHSACPRCLHKKGCTCQAQTCCGGLCHVCTAGVVQQHEAHNAEVNCLAFNPYSEHILATGSADKTVRPLTKSPLSASCPALAFAYQVVSSKFVFVHATMLRLCTCSCHKTITG